MSQHKRKSLRAGAAAFGLLLLFGTTYLFFGWGLKTSDTEASYGLIAYWSEANGQAFEEPFAIAVDARNGNVVVTDAKAQRVAVFDDEGNFIRSIGSPGEGPGEFQNPTGVAVGPDGSIYVADFDLDRIQQFSESGEFLLSWGSSGDGDDQFDSPNGLAVDEAGNVYVADFYNKVVKVFDAEGDFLRTVGKPGQWGRGALDYPTGVDVSAHGALFVADAYNYRIQKFDSDGHPESNWGWRLFRLVPRPSDSRRGFNVPTGVTLDPKRGFIHVADSANHRVVMLDREGAFVTEWEIPEEGSGYHTPVAVAASPDGKRLYVTDIANQRVILLAVER